MHEIDETGGLKEVHAATGGGWGGILVDQAFKALLVELFGGQVYENFTKIETDDWLDLWRAFEVKKKTVDPKKTDKIVMTLPVSLLDLYKETNNTNADKAMQSSRFASKIDLRKNKLSFSHDVMKELFGRSIQSTISCIRDLLRDRKVKNIEAILMVGGYSDSLMLQDAVRRSFQHLTIITPQLASSAILRGAVIFGHNPVAITHRVLKKTYGRYGLAPFIEGKHPANKKKVFDDRIKCLDVFKRYAEKGHTIAVGETVDLKSTNIPARSEQTNINYRIYASDLHNPSFVDEGCMYLGELKVDLSSLPKEMDRKEKQVSFQITFGDTELKATATVLKTGEVFSGTFDFLG